jgi:tRNA A-37 threonylcarbamoyl transferase component Bud32
MKVAMKGANILSLNKHYGSSSPQGIVRNTIGANPYNYQGRSAVRLAGVSEISRVLGVSSQRVSQLKKQSGFPAPIADLSAGPIWDLDQVERWKAAGLQRKSGRPSKGGRALGGRFELEPEPIGSGGFADVYRAVDLSRDPDDADAVVAVKVLRVPETQARARFARELRLLEEIAHPNIVPVLGSGEDEAGRPWYAMPLAKGNLLDELTGVGSDTRRLVDTLRQVCAGLQHLHQEVGIFHRDLTPMNVLRTREGAWAISDFGLAREAERRTTTITSMHVGLGTFLYQAPEAMTHARDVDASADIYSLGKVLHALVKGEHPLPGEEPPGSQFRSIIKKATRLDPSERYGSVTEFVDDLQLVSAAPAGRWERHDEALARLQALLRQTPASDATLLEVLALGKAQLAEPSPDFESMAYLLPFVQAPDIKLLWHLDEDGFRGVFRAFAEHIASAGFSFEYCDTLANFVQQAVEQTGDDDVLRRSITALAGLGENHNRWHVRGVLISLLQAIRTADRALVALEGLRDAASHLKWNLTDFTIRSLHPTLRVGVEEIMEGETGPSDG